MDEIIIYKSKWKAIKLILLALPFIVVSGYALLFNHNILPAYLAWPGLIFFGLAIPLGLYQLFDMRAQIIINETGIFDRTAYKDFINWNAIEHAYWKTVHRQPFVCLIIKDEFKDLIKSNSKLKLVRLAMGFQEVNISLGSVRNVDQEKLTALIINLANANPVDRDRMLTGYTLNKKQ